MENNSFTAADLKIGEKGIVQGITGDQIFKQKLSSMGIIKGCVINAPTTSVLENPRTYMIKGFRLCMRTNEANNILLEKS